MNDQPRTHCESCKAPIWEMSRYCGAYVCDDCDHHNGLARCYCGWSEGGGNGRAELEEMGETIDADY